MTTALSCSLPVYIPGIWPNNDLRIIVQPACIYTGHMARLNDHRIIVQPACIYTRHMARLSVYTRPPDTDHRFIGQPVCIYQAYGQTMAIALSCSLPVVYAPGVWPGCLYTPGICHAPDNDHRFIVQPACSLYTIVCPGLMCYSNELF